MMLLLAFWVAVVYRSSLNSFPSHVHAWTQSDRYALTIGYLDNGLGLFKPSTPNLWPKYPPATMPEKLEGITKADLPLTEYIAARLMKLTSIRQPIVHRGLNLLVAITGLLLLYGTARRMGSSVAMAFLVVAFALLSPVFAYYLDGFIPGIPAIGLIMAAYYAFYRHAETGRIRFFAIAAALSTLAALIRPPMLMALVALVVASLVQGPKQSAFKVLTISVLSLLTFGVFQLYNAHLATTYGSLFISSLMPAGSLAEFNTAMLSSISNWKLEYFSYVHYLILAVSIFLLIIFRHNIFQTPKKTLLTAALLHLAAAAAYFVVMARQFPDHDYYFLESFFLPLVLLVAIGLSLPQADNHLRKLMFGVVLVLATWLMADAALASREKRYTSHPWDMTETTRKLFEGSAAWLDSIGISRNEKILVPDSYTTNVPLLLMERKGFTVINTTRENLLESLDWPFDYLVIANRSLPADVLRNLPELSDRLVPLANNGRLGLYRYDPNAGHKPIAALLMSSSTFSMSPLQQDTTIMEPETEFMELINVPYEASDAVRAIVFQAMARSQLPATKDLHLVADISSPEGQMFYDSFRLDPFFNQSGLKDIGAFINLPSSVKQGAALKCYLWNAGRNHIRLHDIKLDIAHFENLKTP
ncbi:MAG TPA: glycosyltransferase family 39 protein [Bacteroidales bacterium]|nr:glycosyltransferase family 39 protein [Bacteroidales bacterium]